MLLLRALQRAPEERYRSAGGLADDLSHWLHREPLEAGRATAAYFFRRWLERHSAAAIIAVASLTLAASSALTYILSIRHERDRAARAEQVLGELAGRLLREPAASAVPSPEAQHALLAALEAQGRADDAAALRTLFDREAAAGAGKAKPHGF
jgi:hypothetical protein